MSQVAQSFLELTVGRYRLALQADCVIGVLTSVPVQESAMLRGEPLPFSDLRARLGGPPRDVAPFGVAFEAKDGRAMVGVDAVDHLRPGDTPLIQAVPVFGLLRPDLFEGALIQPRGLLLILARSVLLELTAAK